MTRWRVNVRTYMAIFGTLGVFFYAVIIRPRFGLVLYLCLVAVLIDHALPTYDTKYLG
jgi:hypothetical protein